MTLDKLEVGKDAVIESVGGKGALESMIPILCGAVRHI